MKNLFLHILCTVFLFLIFRYFKRYHVNAFHAIVINYYACILIGISFLPDKSLFFNLSLDEKWILPGITAGALFAPTFYLMGLTVEKVNISVATVANKMSLIIPVVFSLLYLQKGPDHFSLINLTGVVIALISIVLTSYRKAKKSTAQTGAFTLILLPLSIFLSGGVIDTIIHYTNYIHLHGTHKLIFPLVMFSTACISGSIILSIKWIYEKKILSWKDLIGGLILGIPNYFSLFFLMRTLSDFNNDGAVVFPIINIGVIVSASLIAVILFKEKLSGMNLAGIFLSVISVILVFW